MISPYSHTYIAAIMRDKKLSPYSLYHQHTYNWCINREYSSHNAATSIIHLDITHRPISLTHSNRNFLSERSVVDDSLLEYMDVLERRHDLNVCVKVSQIDRPSSGLQDLIRTPTGKDYGYSQTIDREIMICLRHHRTCMACMIDPQEGGWYPSSTNLDFFFSLLAAAVSVFPSASMQEDALVFWYLARLTGCTCSYASLFLPMEVADLAAAPPFDAQGTGRLAFLSHLFSYCLDRISQA